MNATEIPWAKIGAFGCFAIVVLFIALWFILKWRKVTNTSGATTSRSKCINDPRAQGCLTDLAMSREAMGEMKGDMKMLREKSVEQTGILTNIYNESKDQTRHLLKIATKAGKR